MRVSLLLLGLTAMLGVDHVRAQDAYGEFLRAPLVGIELVAPEVDVTWHEAITEVSRAQFEVSLRDAFELGLLRAGLKLSSDDLDHVVLCSIRLLSNEGLVAFSFEVKLSEIVSDSQTSDRYLGETWSRGAVGTVGEENLSEHAKTMGTDCAEWFEAEWRRANQGG